MTKIDAELEGGGFEERVAMANFNLLTGRDPADI